MEPTTNPGPGFVVAFNRDRDFYQVPLALHERGLLDRLVTDMYLPDEPRCLRQSRFSHRRIDGLPSRQVSWNAPALFWQLMGLRAGMPRLQVFERVDAALSRAALARSVRTGADLLLYSHYAFEAFTSPAAAQKKKGLFKFHPDSLLIREILQRDFADHPECAWSFAREEDTGAEVQRADRLTEEWRRADGVICASTFTKRSLIHAGCPAEKITVVPYGIDLARVPYEPGAKLSTPCRFLFVGQGVQRKGLHHLLAAWKRARLPNAKLTIVAAEIDPGIARMAAGNVEIMGRQSTSELRSLYAASNVFVLPSLVEGFGLVFLEALAAGCFCIGTSNTGLPDLDPPVLVAKVVPPADVPALQQALEAACASCERGDIDSTAIRAFAETRTWPLFRAQVADWAARLSGSRGKPSPAIV